MRRIAKQSAVVMLMGLVAMAPTLSFGQGGTSPLLPPNANFRGKSFNEWNVLSAQWTIGVGLGEQDLPNTVGGMRFLPGAFVPGTYEASVEVRSGTGLVFPSFFVYGELYADGSYDDPVALAELLQFIYETTHVETKVDGRVVLSGSGAEIEDFQYGVTFFDEPIFYADPQPRPGFPDAVAALWTMGIGSVYRPLSVGEHTLESKVTSLFFGEFTYIYHITVVAPGR